MFRFQSLVYQLLCIALLNFGFSSFAQPAVGGLKLARVQTPPRTNPSSSATSPSTPAQAAPAVEAEPAVTATTPVTTAVPRYQFDQNRTDEILASCRTAIEAFGQKRQEFVNKCGTYNSNGSPGHIGCSLQMLCCSNPNDDQTAECKTQLGDSNALKQAGLRFRDQARKLTEQLRDLRQSSSSSSETVDSNRAALQETRNELNQLKRSSELYGICPIRAAVDVKSAFELTKEAREEVEKREGDISDLEGQIIDAQADQQKDIQRIDGEINKLERETKVDLRKVREQFEEDEEKAILAIEENQKRLEEQNNALMTLDLQKTAASAKRDREKLDLIRNCRQQAITKVQAKRTRNLEKGRNKNYSKSMRNLYSSSGRDTAGDIEVEVEAEVEKCKSTTTYKEDYVIISKNYQSAVSSLEQQIRLIKTQSIPRINRAIEKIQTTDTLKFTNRAKEKVEEITTNYSTRIAELSAEKASVNDIAQKKIARLQDQISKKTSHLQAAQDYLANVESEYSLRRTAGADTNQNIEGKQFAEAQGAYNGLISAGQNAISTCGDLCNNPSAGVGNSLNGISQFLSSVGSYTIRHPGCSSSGSSQGSDQGTSGITDSTAD